MDLTRATQMVTWAGSIQTGGQDLDTASAIVYGTKDRSWGIRSVGDPAPAAPASTAAQIFFLWAPVHFDDECLHYMVFEDAAGVPWLSNAAALPLLGPKDAVFGPAALGRSLGEVRHRVRWAPGRRRSDGAVLTLADSEVRLEPMITFRMRGIGYWHPVWAHGRWHGGEKVAGEEYKVEDLDTLALDCVHVQQVMRATWGDRRGLGVLEQLVVGPHEPSGFRALLDGAPSS
jgi:hypothetical protein